MSTLEQLKEKNQELEQRVEKLEQRFENPPVSRRAALAGGAGLVGLSALSGSASAGSNQVGTIGTNSDPVDIEAEDIFATQVGNDSNRPTIFADNVGARSIADNHLYAGEFSGSSPDARLDACLQAASEADVIYLEKGDYTQDRAISTRGLRIVGAGADEGGTAISGTITLATSKTDIMHVALRDSNFANTGKIVVDGGEFGRHLVMDIIIGNIEITQGTRFSVVAFARSVGITDNGGGNKIIANT